MPESKRSLLASLRPAWMDQPIVIHSSRTAIAAPVATYFGPGVLVFGACVFLMGFLCALAHLGLFR